MTHTLQIVVTLRVTQRKVHCQWVSVEVGRLIENMRRSQDTTEWTTEWTEEEVATLGWDGQF